MEQIGSEYNFKTGGSIKALNDVIARVEELEKALNKTQKATDNAGNSVDNTAKKTKKAKAEFDSLGNSINQVTRELPAFAFSAQTGFLAISNNIPILLDSINQLRDANKALAAEGKATIPVFKQIISSLVSWQTGLSLLISFSVMYAKEIGNFFSEFIKGKISIDEATESIQLYYKAFKGTEVTDAISNIEKLKINVDLARDGFVKKEEVLMFYNKTIGQTAGELETFYQVEDFLIKNADAYVKMTLYKAAANLSLEEAAKSLIKVQEDVATSLDVALINARYDESLRIVRSTIKDKKELANEEIEIEKARQKEIDDFTKKSNFASVQAYNQQKNIAKKFLSDAAKIANELNFDFLGVKNKDKESKKLEEAAAKAKEVTKKKVQDELNIAQEAYIKEISNKDATNETKEKAEIKLLESQIRIYEKYKKEDKEYAQSLLDVREKLAEKILGINEKSRADYLKGLQEEYKNDEALMQKTIDNQLDKINEDYASMKEGKILSLEEQRKLDLEHTQTLIAYLELVKDAGEKYSDKLVKLKEKESRLLTQINNKTNNEIVEDDEQRARRQEQIIMGISQTASSISSDLFDLRKSELEEETNIQIKELDKQKEAKIITEEQYEQKRKEILNKQAKKQRELDLAEIQVKTALAVITAIALSPLTFGLPFSAFALAQGLAQYAFAASKPLPQFAKGTDRVIGGVKGKDSVHALLMPDEAVIPTKENLARPGLAKAWISGNLDNHLMMNYIKPAIDENNKKWEATLKLNQNSTFIRNDNFSDKKIVKTLEGIKRSLVKENKVVYKRNNRLWNLG